MNVTFFQVNKGHAPTELKKLEKRPCNNLFWSPQGQFVVLAGLRNMSGALEFIDTRDFQVCIYLVCQIYIYIYTFMYIQVCCFVDEYDHQLELIMLFSQVMKSTEHFMATDIEWDPTGRYVASCVSWWGHKVSILYRAIRQAKQSCQQGNLMQASFT